MNKERLSFGTKVALIFAGLFWDGLKVVLDFGGVGLILDPFLITPLAAFTFAIILSESGIEVSMFSGKNSWAGWVNLLFSLVPILDILPDWTVYAIYLVVKYR